MSVEGTKIWIEWLFFEKPTITILTFFEKVKKTSRKGGKDTNEKGRKRKLRSEDGDKDGYREYDDVNKATSDNEGKGISVMRTALMFCNPVKHGGECLNFLCQVPCTPIWTAAATSS